ncbi:unnamed protein product [Polarella glacialis]|uniref:Uncharacterized protein n=1 Tax=Polarella glacialis TaxID=89957 RepID=A0A813DWP1_POLGL|nr:unnamed protein product [Polarella glacialis]CAE8694843.1 unnamed protein product [Polarella glacialis]
MASSSYDLELAELMAESSDQSEAPVARKTMTLRKAAALAVVGMVGFAALATASGKAQLVSAKTADWVGLAESDPAELATKAAEVAKEEPALQAAVEGAAVQVAHEMKTIQEDTKKHPAQLAKDIAEMDTMMKELEVAKTATLEEMVAAQEIAALQANEAQKKAAAMADKKAAAAAAKKAETAAKKAEEQLKQMAEAAREAIVVQKAVDEELEAAMKEIKDAKVTAAIKKIEDEEKKAKERGFPNFPLPATIKAITEETKKKAEKVEKAVKAEPKMSATQVNAAKAELEAEVAEGTKLVEAATK